MIRVARLPWLLPVYLAACAAPTAHPNATAPTPVTVAAAVSTGSPTPERLAFWRDVRAHDDAPPAGADVAALARELVGYLGATDPDVRDGLATDVLERWIRKDARLSAEELRSLTATLYDGLAVGIGATNGDGVFGRSFSALILSMVAARDLATPFLRDEELTKMLDTAAWYAGAEADLRGHVDRLGWAHAAAHTADWLKFIARHPSLGAARSATVLTAVLSLTVRRHGALLHHGEDSRLAQPVLELLRTQQIDAAAFETWIGKLVEPLLAKSAAAWDPALYAAQRNARNLLFTLYVLLSVEASPNPTQSAAIAILHKTIAS
jgi:hypothetical protein